MIYSDKALSQKLERTEARTNADFVETRARLNPACRAGWIEVGGAYAMFDGVESPLTQTFGLGIFEETTPEHLDEIEAFFRERYAPVFHEVSPMADPALMTLLSERGYRPMELTSVMYGQLDVPIQERDRIAGLTTRVIDESEVELWARTSAEAWTAEQKELGDFMFNFGSVSASCRGSYPYIAELQGQAISTGMLFIYEDVCMLAGASTIPEGRKQGAQILCSGTGLILLRVRAAASQ